MRRYPHTVTIEIVTEVDNGSGITATTKDQFQLKGRYEPAGQRNSLDQAAKFYCPKNSLFDNGNLRGQKLNFNDSWLTINDAFNYQSHAELWLD